MAPSDPVASHLSPADQAPLLTVRDLRITFPTARGDLTAVDGISYSLAARRTLGIVGESGSGKTVSALALLRLTPPQARLSGTILFEGQDIATLDDSAMEKLRGNRIAMVFQEPMTALNPVLTIGEQIAEAWIIHRGLDREAAREAAVAMIGKVGIPDPERRADSYPHQLSGGQRQRAMIAMALACGPALLVADEPTTALDVTVQAQILDLVMQMQAEFGMAILFISHNLAVVSEVADDVAVMYAGRIVELAPAAEIFANPLHPYTRGLIETVPRIGHGRKKLPAIRGTVPDPLSLPAGCRFSNRCPLADDHCRRADPPLTEPTPGRLVACYKPGVRP
jgi:oligopeptide/dipeptide ABC transporter ATP-binding protein